MLFLATVELQRGGGKYVLPLRLELIHMHLLMFLMATINLKLSCCQCWIDIRNYCKNYAASNYQPKDTRTGGGGTDDSINSLKSLEEWEPHGSKDIIDVSV